MSTKNIISEHTSNLLGEDVKKNIEEIAAEENFEEFEIIVKEQNFTGDNFLGEISRIKIKPINHSRRKSINLIMKKAPLSTAAREAVSVSAYYRTEIFVYTDIVPAFYKLQRENNVPPTELFEFAKFYKANTEEFKEMVIMRDLAEDGFTMHDKALPLDFQHVTLVIQNLARFHAASFVMKEKDAGLFSKLISNIPQTVNFGDWVVQMVEKMRDKILEQIDCAANKSKLQDFTQNVMKKFEYFLDASLTDPFNVICYGDCWNNNMMFKYENSEATKVMFIDWQVTRLASPVTDLSFFIFMSMNREFLETHLQHFLDLYHETLTVAINKMGCDIEKCYPKEIFEAHLKKLMAFGLMMSLIGIPIILSEPGEAKTIEDNAKDLKDGQMQMKLSDRAGQRLNNSITYCIKRGII